MSLDHISATMTHVMCREEHICNVSVLQTVHFSTPFTCDGRADGSSDLTKLIGAFLQILVQYLTY
jgi:hypothetical protein